VVNREEQVTSVRQAAAVCNVTPPVVRRWLSLGLIPGRPWTLQQLHNVRDMTDPQGRRRGPKVTHGTMTRWNEGCSCTRCRQAQNDAARAGDEPERRSGYQPKCGSSSSTPSTAVSRSGRCS
jgi:hypothetical protein